MLKLEHLAELLVQHRAAVPVRVRDFAVGGRSFAFNEKPAIMGVVNLSADSWYRVCCVCVCVCVCDGRFYHAETSVSSTPAVSPYETVSLQHDLYIWHK